MKKTFLKMKSLTEKKIHILSFLQREKIFIVGDKWPVHSSPHNENIFVGIKEIP